MRIQIYIYSSDPLTCAGLGALLSGQEDFEIVGKSSRVDEARATIREIIPDVIIMGGCADSSLHREFSTVAKVVAVADIGGMSTTAEVLALNAQAVLSPGGTPGELMHAIRIVAEGDTVLMPSAVRPHVEAAAQKAATSRRGAAVAELTAREVDVLRLIAQGLSTSDIAGRMFVSDATVRSHVHHILQKLDVRSRTHAVAIAYESGLISLAEPDCERGRADGAKRPSAEAGTLTVINL